MDEMNTFKRREGEKILKWTVQDVRKQDGYLQSERMGNGGGEGVEVGHHGLRQMNEMHACAMTQ